MLAIVPRGAAGLAGLAGLCAAGLVVARPPVRLGALRVPAALLAALLVWGALSLAWSIGPWRTTIMELRLLGLFAAALALAAAADRIAAPPRLCRALLIGTAVAIVLALGDLESAGGLRQYVSVRAFGAPRLNSAAVWLAIMPLPTAAMFRLRGKPIVGLALAAAMGVTVCVLAGTTAKVALALSLPVALLMYLWRRPVGRLAAALSRLVIVTAPLTLPRLDRLPGLFVTADQIKDSAGHRLLIWSFVGDRIAERPFLGWGLDASRAIPGGSDEIRPGQPWLPLHPHNAALQVWLELGVPGAALFALLVGWLWLRLAEGPWPPFYAAAAGGGFSAALAAAFSGWGIWEEWWIATLAFALFAVLVMARAAPATPPQPLGWRGGGR